MRNLLLLVVLSACVSAPGEDPLSKRLIGSKVVYDMAEGAEGPPRTQTWAADGTTVFDAGPGLFGGVQKGRWEVRYGRYCSEFASKPIPKQDWTCWRVTQSEGGKRIRFVEITGDLIPIFQRDYKGTFAE